MRKAMQLHKNTTYVFAGSIENIINIKIILVGLTTE
jgi:hypothetical protein